ncbi:MAG: YbaB/EbfC family nucleoid-associated protein [Buchnera aphidicola (Nurudea ibofushi)]
MFSNNGLNNLMQQAQEIQEKMQRIRKEVSSIEVTGESGAGIVKVTLIGTNNCKKIEIDSTLIVKNEKIILEDLIVAAFNDAIRKMSELRKKKMSSISSEIPFNKELDTSF